jgi:hypothetical protein
MRLSLFDAAYRDAALFVAVEARTEISLPSQKGRVDRRKRRADIVGLAGRDTRGRGGEAAGGLAATEGELSPPRMRPAFQDGDTCRAALLGRSSRS